MNHEHIRPPQVKGAIQSGNHAALSAMGKKGAEHRQLKKEMAQEERALDFTERAKIAIETEDGDVVVPDDLAEEPHIEGAE